jgi:hypothetical protein
LIWLGYTDADEAVLNTVYIEEKRKEKENPPVSNWQQHHLYNLHYSAMYEKSHLITEWINLIPLVTVYSEEHSEKFKTCTLLVSCRCVQVLITTKKTYHRILCRRSREKKRAKLFLLYF